MSDCVRLCWEKIALSWSRSKFGSGNFPATRDALEMRPSRRPSSTSNDGPPARTTTSRAAMAKMSAHDTTPGQLASTACFALITVAIGSIRPRSCAVLAKKNGPRIFFKGKKRKGKEETLVVLLHARAYKGF